MPVVIDQCRLCGTAAAIAHGKRQLQTNWLPSVPDPEIVIVRRIETRSIANEMPHRLYHQADRLLGARVDGWSESALDADCVFFDSAADLLARLSLDIALDRAAGIWFWRSFRSNFGQDRPAALSRLWQERYADLPAAIVCLHRRDQLISVWRVLSNEAAVRLLPLVLPTAMVGALDDDGSQSPVRPTAVPASILALAGSLTAWHPPSGSLDTSAPVHRLAFALAVAALRPHWLAGGSRDQFCRAWSAYRQSLPNSLASSSPAGGHRLAAAEASRVTALPGEGVESGAPSRAAVTAGNGTAPTANGMNEPNVDPIDTDFIDQVDLYTARNRSGMSEQESVTAPSDSAGMPWKSPAEWRVEQGGLFYLLNLLNLQWSRERLFGDPAAMAFPSGWGWLYRLGEAFGLQPETALTQCLACLSDISQREFPSRLPAFDAGLQILEYGRQRYASFGIWEPGLLLQTAHVIYRRPELDISYRIGGLDTRVRRAALDVDPGWVDWLGTRVRFHYRDAI